MSNFLIIRVGKLKNNSGLSGAIRHNLREEGAVIPGLDPSRSHLNIQIGASTRSDLFKSMRDRLATTTRKPRTDSVKVLEYMVSASPDYMNSLTYEDQKKYLLDAVELVKQKHGADNVIHASLHFDEKTPHAHVWAVPLVTEMRKTKHKEREIVTLSAKTSLGGREGLEDLQTSATAFMQERGWKVRRGVSKAQTNRLHVPLKSYHEQERERIESSIAEHLDDAARASTKATDLLKRVKIFSQEMEAKAQRGHAVLAAHALAVHRSHDEVGFHLDARAKHLAKREKFAPAIAAGSRIATPDEAKILDFMKDNPDAKTVMELMQSNPLLAEVFASSVRENIAHDAVHHEDEKSMFERLREPTAKPQRGRGHAEESPSFGFN